MRQFTVKGLRLQVQRFYFLLLITCCGLLITMTGCGPTYPKAKFDESIIKICKKEYGLDVKVALISKTIAIYLPLENLIDFTFSVTKSAGEKINDVILSVSRVALSSDAEYDFYTVIAHDIRIPEIQIVIVKSVDDVKRFLLNDISRSEYAKRMIVDIRLSPQAQKERAIKEIFEKTKVDKRWQDEVMNDFFRSEPAGLGDIGYWNNRFYIKDITMPEFLAEQIASRVRMAFREEKDLVDNFLLKSSKCAYLSKGGEKFFKLDLTAENRYFGMPDEKTAAGRIFEVVLGIAAQVLHNYRFTDYSYVTISNQMGRESLKVLQDELEAFRTGKVEFENFADKILIN